VLGGGYKEFEVSSSYLLDLNLSLLNQVHTLRPYLCTMHSIMQSLGTWDSSTGTATTVQAGKPRNQGLISNRGQNSYTNCTNVQNVIFEDTYHTVSARQFLAFKDTFCHTYHSSRTNIILHLHISSCLQRSTTMHQSTPDTHQQRNTRRFLPSTHRTLLEL
jgi:hypothetical protein